MLLATRTFIIQKKHFMIQQIRAVTHQIKGGYVTLTTSFLRKEHTMVFSTLTQTMEIELLLCDSLTRKGPYDLPSSGVVSLVVDIEDTRATFPSSIVLPYLPGFTSQLPIAHLFKNKNLSKN